MGEVDADAAGGGVWGGLGGGMWEGEREEGRGKEGGMVLGEGRRGKGREKEEREERSG